MERLVQRERTLPEPLGQRLALQVLHDQEVGLAVPAHVMDVQIWGWFRLEMVFASRSNRDFRSESEATCAGSTLMATVRSSRVSVGPAVRPTPF